MGSRPMTGTEGDNGGAAAVDLDAPIRIVISYRRDDAAGHAGHLYADLVSRFGEDRVFIDIDNIEPGLDFAEVISTAIKAADVLIAVIGKTWLSATDKNGRRKIDKEDDFVRLEIESAVTRKLRVLPLLVQEAEMPSTDELPPTLATFARRNALEISDKRWRADVNELIELLEEIAQEKVQRVARQEAGKQARKERSARDSGQALRSEALREEAVRERDRREQAVHDQAVREQAAREQVLRDAEEQAQRDRERDLRAAQEATRLEQAAPPSWSAAPVSPAGPGGAAWQAGGQSRQAGGPEPAKAKPWLIGVAAAVVVVLIAVAALLVTSGGGGSSSDGTASDTTEVPAVPETVAVLGDVQWNDTGIDLVAGQAVEITASGTIETAKGDPSRNSGPDGKSGEVFAKGNNIIPEENHGALIGRIGSGTPFGVGSSRTFTADSDGRLYLGNNDKGVENNAGQYVATITVG